MFEVCRLRGGCCVWMEVEKGRSHEQTGSKVVCDIVSGPLESSPDLSLIFGRQICGATQNRRHPRGTFRNQFLSIAHAVKNLALNASSQGWKERSGSGIVRKLRTRCRNRLVCIHHLMSSMDSHACVSMASVQMLTRRLIVPKTRKASLLKSVCHMY